MEEEINQEEKNLKENNNKPKHCWCTYTKYVLATLVGTFLAFYFVADMTVNRMMDPMYQIKRMEKRIQKEGRTATMTHQKMVKESGLPMHRSFVMLEKGKSEYKIIVDLKPFDNDPDDINVVVNDKDVTISGEVERDGLGEDRFMRFSQTFYLDEKIDANKIIKTSQRDKCIIILPFKK